MIISTYIKIGEHMSTKTEYLDMIKMLFEKYFKKYFAGQDINKAVYERLIKTLQNLTLCLIELQLFYHSLCCIKQNKTFWKKLDKESKSQLNLIIKGIDCMSKEIYSILLPIVKGLKE